MHLVFFSGRSDKTESNANMPELWAKGENDVERDNREFANNDSRECPQNEKSVTGDNDMQKTETVTVAVLEENTPTKLVYFSCPKVPEKARNLKEPEATIDVLPANSTTDSEEHVYDVPFAVPSTPNMGMTIPVHAPGYERLSNADYSEHYRRLSQKKEDTIFYDSFDIFASLEAALNEEYPETYSELDDLNWDGGGADCEFPPPPLPPTPPLPGPEDGK